MKKIGMIGGMSPESTVEYYQLMNGIIAKHFGGLHSAKCVIDSLNLEEIKILMDQDKWEEITDIMVSSAQGLESAGAEFVLICTNTIHKIADEVQNEINIPLLHIADATAGEIKKQEIKTVGLLGTKFVMEQDFYSGRLLEKFGIKVIVPNENERPIVHDVIFDELCLGEINVSSRYEFKDIIENLIRNGAEGIILGCTEIPMLIKNDDVAVFLFDTAKIHAEAAVKYALAQAL